MENQICNLSLWEYAFTMKPNDNPTIRIITLAKFLSAHTEKTWLQPTDHLIKCLHRVLEIISMLQSRLKTTEKHIDPCRVEATHVLR